MIKPRLLVLLLCSSALAASLFGQNFDAHRQLEKANRETFPWAVKTIAEQTDTRLIIDLDASSFATDEKAWSNLPLIANRLVGALGEVGRDQAGKDAIAKNVQKVVIAKLGAETKADVVTIKDGTLTIQTAATDPAMSLLQSVIVAAFEKIL